MNESAYMYTMDQNILIQQFAALFSVFSMIPSAGIKETLEIFLSRALAIAITCARNN